MGVFSYLNKNKALRESDSEMDNVIDSMFNSKPLYDELKVKCHPDLFMDEEKKGKAQSLFQKLQKSKHNILAMNDLKPEIEALFRER